MTWTDELPPSPGWYWWQPTYSEPEVVRVTANATGPGGDRARLVERAGSSFATRIHAGTGRWAGPLDAPKEDA